MEWNVFSRSSTKKLLPGRLLAETSLAKVNWEITHACSDVEKAISADTSEDDIIKDFMKPFTDEFDKCAARFRAVKKQFNAFADSVAGDLKQLSQDHIAVKFDSCIRHSDQAIDSFDGILDIGRNVFEMTTDVVLKLTRIVGFFDAALKFTGEFHDTSFECFKNFASDFFKWAKTELPTSVEKEQAVSSEAMRLGIKFDLLFEQASKREIDDLYLEIQCLCKKLGKTVPTLHPDMGKPPAEIPALPSGMKALVVKEWQKSMPKRRKLDDLEWLIKDLPEIKTMLDRHQIKLLDEVIAMHNETSAADGTQVEN